MIVFRRVRHIYFCLLTTISTLMLVEWKGREKAWLTMVLEVNYNLRRFKSSDLEGVIRINRECLPENYTSLFFMNLYKRLVMMFSPISSSILLFIRWILREIFLWSLSSWAASSPDWRPVAPD